MKEIRKEIMEVVMLIDQGDKELTGWISKRKTIKSVLKLPGDASTRMYYRVELKDGKTYILMKMEPFKDQGTTLPFIVMQKHLEAAGVDVPTIYDVDPAKGFMLLEDLGDVTMLRHLQEVASDDVERHLYERVIDELVEMHLKASPGPNKARFDHDKLMWEINFCIEHFYEKYLGRKIAKADRNVMERSFSGICQILHDEPMVFTHRDFHSRNVMVVPGKKHDRLVMIDFQDARLGPVQYDLASLLKDSYYQLEERQVDRLLDYYIVKWEATAGEPVDREHFKYIFDLMSVQRNFKAIGSFASFLNRRGNATYLKYIGNTFENIRRTLLKYPQYARLRETLFHYYYF